MPDCKQCKLINENETAVCNKFKHLDVLCFSSLFRSGRFVRFPVNWQNPISWISREGFMKTVSMCSIYGKRRCVNSQVVCTTWLRVQGSKHYCGLVDDHNVQVWLGPGGVNLSMYCIPECSIYAAGSLYDTKVWVSSHSPTLFLTLGCFEYGSFDYFGKVNNSYLTGKLCMEKSISVLRKFFPKFHDFFETIFIPSSSHWHEYM